MLKLFSSVPKSPAASLAFRTGARNLLSQRYKSTFIVENGPALFKEHFGEENVGPIEKVTLAKGTELIGPTKHEYATPEKPGVFLRKPSPLGYGMAADDLDEGVNVISCFKLTRKSECYQANVREKFFGKFIHGPGSEVVLVHADNVGPLNPSP